MAKAIRWIWDRVAGNAIWDGAKWLLPVLWSVAGSAVITAFFWLAELVRSRLDYFSVGIIFVIGSGVLYLSAKLYLFQQRRTNSAIAVLPNHTLHQSAPARLTLVDVVPECSPSDTQWTFKSKIRVVLRNDTGKPIEVTSPHWSFTDDDIPCEAQVESTLQLEGPKGFQENDWQREAARIHVRPGRVFRVWVGLLLDVNRSPNERNNELRRRSVTRELGTLSLIIDNSEWALHL